MIWLTWRQFRVQAITAGAALAAFAILLAATGPHLASMYSSSRITGCHGGICATAASDFLGRLHATSTYPVVYLLGIALVLAAPAIIGIFWGAPLIAREFETGTYRLAWTQSITRTRWLSVKLALTGLAAMVVTEALSLMQAWWAAPIGRAAGLGASTPLLDGGRFSSLVFATHGVTPLGYSAFGFALGTAVGALIRRAVPAMAVTLAVFAAAQLVMPLWVRPHLIPPDRAITTFVAARMVDLPTLGATVVPGQPGAWIISSGPSSTSGQQVTAGASCFPPPPAKAPTAAAVSHCLDSQGIREAITYQPGSRYWPFEWIETGIYLVFALALAGFCFWRLGRRRT
jgi:hypothetical protein